MRHWFALLTLLSIIAVAGVVAMSAQAQVPAPAGFLSVGTLALAQAPSAADSSSGSQSSTGSSTQSTTQSSTPSSGTTETRHASSTTTAWPVSPLWIAIGAIALVALIAVIVASARKDSGSTTTIVK